jgi:hypothetical protein
MGAARASADDITWGVNDDAGKYEQGDGPFWSTLIGVGMTSDTITLRWDETSPTGFAGSEEQFLAPSLAAADEAGVAVTFDVYPLHSAALADPANVAKFAAWVAQLAQTYPDVTEYVVMNECNTSLFANPQYVGKTNMSAPRCGTFLAAGYDALKSVDPTIFVWGLGLSPRGNPVPKDGSSPRSTNPIDWLTYLGQWYRSTGRTTPLMDGLDLHPYPIPQNLSFEQGYNDPTSFGVTSLARAYQAFYSAFNGTGQPTVGPGKLPVSLNEVGIQTTPAAAVAGSYTGAENGEGVAATGDEAYQAAWYTKLVDFALCDADITKVNIFKLVDESALEGWQSGLFYQGYLPKQSAAAFSNELETTGGACPTGTATYFTPSLQRVITGKPVVKKAKPRLKPVRKAAKPKRHVTHRKPGPRANHAKPAAKRK